MAKAEVSEGSDSQSRSPEPNRAQGFAAAPLKIQHHCDYARALWCKTVLLEEVDFWQDLIRQVNDCCSLQAWSFRGHFCLKAHLYAIWEKHKPGKTFFCLTNFTQQNKKLREHNTGTHVCVQVRVNTPVQRPGTKHVVFHTHYRNDVC